MREGELQALREWLVRNIHRQGMRYRANELCEVVTGSPLSVAPFMEYVRAKFKPIYGLP
jgi:carboxypeptidase Taq